MAEIVYILCAGTSLLCVFLLMRKYLKRKTPLLLWSAICFFGLSLNNVLLFIDLVVVPDHDLSMYRGVAALSGAVILLFGLVWETV